MRIVVRILATAVATGLAAWLLPGIFVAGSDLAEKTVTLLVVAILIGVVNAFVRPIVTTLSGCFVILTLGLFLFVINALMLLLVSWGAAKLGVGFEVAGFWSALFGSIIISLVSGGIYGLFYRQEPQR